MDAGRETTPSGEPRRLRWTLWNALTLAASRGTEGCAANRTPRRRDRQLEQDGTGKDESRASPPENASIRCFKDVGTGDRSQRLRRHGRAMSHVNILVSVRAI